jgi:hypothetical protein
MLVGLLFGSGVTWMRFAATAGNDVPPLMRCDEIWLRSIHQLCPGREGFGRADGDEYRLEDLGRVLRAKVLM